MHRFIMETTMYKIQKNVDSILGYLTPLLPLANCHMAEFLTYNHWGELLPASLTNSLDSMTLTEAVNCFWKSSKDWNNTGDSELEKWVKMARSHCVTVNNEYCLTKDQLQERIRAWGGTIKPEIQVKEFMSSKKSYEVGAMSALVAALSGACGATCCVEAGGGRGALMAALAHAHGLAALSLDCNPALVRAAQLRTQKMKKVWHTIARRVDGTSHDAKEATHRFASAFVTSDTDLAALARQTFPETSNVRLLLTGLHTCGNLGPDSLRIFCAQPATGAVFNVPCCYHLLTEAADDSLFDVFQRDFGGGTVLGRNARMLAAQSIERVLHLRQLPATSLLYRALLQDVVKKHVGATAILSEGKLKRISSKCENFEQYFKMADSKLQLNLFDTFSKDSFKEISKNSEDIWKKLVLFYFLRLCLAQVVESVILLDRLLLLFEHGFEKVFLVKLFDPVLSPRCHSIVAVR